MEIIQQFDGYWYLPSQKGEKTIIAHGKLQISNSNESFLEIASSKEIVFSAFPQIELMSRSINNQIAIPLILGMGNDKTINKNHSFTLINSEISGYSSNNDFIRITFQAQKTLRGAHVQNKTDLKFQFSMFKFGGIDTWIGKNGFTIDSKRDSKDFGTNVDYVQPKTIEVFRNNRFHAYFYFRATAPAFASGNEVKIVQSVFLNFEFRHPQPLEVHEKLANQFQNFFSLANGNHVKRTNFDLRFASNAVQKRRNVHYPDVALILPDEVLKNKSENDGSYMTFNYETIEHRVIEVFQKWFDLYDNYELVLIQFFENFYRRNLHTESRFVNYLSIMEIYYLRKHGRDLPLAAKIRELLKSHPKIIKALGMNRELFIDKVIIIRRYYVHGKDKNLKKADLDSNNILRLTHRLEHLIKIFLLLELGFNDAEIVKMIERKPWNWGVHK